MTAISKMSTKLGMLADMVHLERQKINEGERIGARFMRGLENDLLALQRDAQDLEGQIAGRK